MAQLVKKELLKKGSFFAAVDTARFECQLLIKLIKNDNYGYGRLLLDVWRHVGGCSSIGGFADLLTSLPIKVEEKEKEC